MVASALLAAIAVLTAACAADKAPPKTATRPTAPRTRDTTSPERPATSAPDAPTTPAPVLHVSAASSSEELKVSKAYLTAELAYLSSAGHPADPPDALERTHIDSMLTGTRARILDLRTKHQAVRLPRNSKRAIYVLQAKVHGAAATLDLCEVDDAVVYDLTTKSVVNDDVVSYKERAMMRHVAGRWLLSHRVLSGGKKQGVVACAG